MLLVIIALAIGGYLWWRRSRRIRMEGRSLATTNEESIPLNVSMAEGNGHGDDDEEKFVENGKGKGRAELLTSSTVRIREAWSVISLACVHVSRRAGLVSTGVNP